jgi:hypothetical protein
MVTFSVADMILKHSLYLKKVQLRHRKSDNRLDNQVSSPTLGYPEVLAVLCSDWLSTASSALLLWTHGLWVRIQHTTYQCLYYAPVCILVCHVFFSLKVVRLGFLYAFHIKWTNWEDPVLLVLLLHRIWSVLSSSNYVSVSNGGGTDLNIKQFWNWETFISRSDGISESWPFGWEAIQRCRPSSKTFTHSPHIIPHRCLMKHG